MRLGRCEPSIRTREVVGEKADRDDDRSKASQTAQGQAGDPWCDPGTRLCARWAGSMVASSRSGAAVDESSAQAWAGRCRAPAPLTARSSVAEERKRHSRGRPRMWRCSSALLIRRQQSASATTHSPDTLARPAAPTSIDVDFSQAPRARTLTTRALSVGSSVTRARARPSHPATMDASQPGFTSFADFAHAHSSVPCR